MNALDLAKLTRVEHGVMYAIAVIIGVLLTGSLPSQEILVLACLVALLSEMGAFSLNDYFDVGADRANNRTDRPLVSGKISPSFALFFGIFCILASLIAAFFISEKIFILTIFLDALAILYNLKLKLLPLIGNVYIAFTMGIPFVFGNFVVEERIASVNVILFFLGFIAGLAREIIKSIEDMKGDKAQRKAATLPILLGEDKSLLFAVSLYVLFLPISFLPFLYLKANIVSYVLFFVAVVLVAANIFYSLRRNYKKARVFSLIAFAFGLLAYLSTLLSF
jgi:geranylgeranylglycerol-phosphate geranylgeranyltransferase